MPPIATTNKQPFLSVNRRSLFCTQGQISKAMQSSACHNPAGKHSRPKAQAEESTTLTSVGTSGSAWGSVGNPCWKEGERRTWACASANIGRQGLESAPLVINQTWAEPALISSISSTQKNTGGTYWFHCTLGFIMIHYESWGRLWSKQQLNMAPPTWRV